MHLLVNDYETQGIPTFLPVYHPMCRLLKGALGKIKVRFSFSAIINNTLCVSLRSFLPCEEDYRDSNPESKVHIFPLSCLDEPPWLSYSIS